MAQQQMSFPEMERSATRNQPRGGRQAPVRKISDARRAYLRRYYQEHKERAREYQRQYNLMHKKKVRVGDNGSLAPREQIRSTFNASDIMRAPTEKSVRYLQMILSGERYFTM